MPIETIFVQIETLHNKRTFLDDQKLINGQKCYDDINMIYANKRIILEDKVNLWK